MAIVLWYLINALNILIKKIPVIGSKIPLRLSLIISTLLTLMVLTFIGGLITQNINGLISSAPDYRVNLESQVERILSAIGYGQDLDFETLEAELNLGDYLRRVLNSFSTIASQFLLILLYTLFMLLEQSTFRKKMLSLGLKKTGPRMCLRY